MTSPRAVVFAYHNVGCRCLAVLLEHGIEVALVVTHNDNPAETLWFDSVARLAVQHRLPVIKPEDPNDRETVARVTALRADFLFSFYYRHMLTTPLLAAARRGALNMHGSLLPRYRGRVPVNWAVIRGETETGATLHYMTEKPDAGDIVDQQAVSILPDDTAFDVFGKVTDAAAAVLRRSLPALISGNAPRVPQNLAAGSYFSGRTPADGRIDWTQSAAAVHNLVRGTAPPYPGAFTGIGGGRLRILRTRPEPARAIAGEPPSIHADRDGCYALCADRRVLHLIEMEYEGRPFGAGDFLARFGAGPIVPETTP